MERPCNARLTPIPSLPTVPRNRMIRHQHNTRVHACDLFEKHGQRTHRLVPHTIRQTTNQRCQKRPNRINHNHRNPIERIPPPPQNLHNPRHHIAHIPPANHLYALQRRKPNVQLRAWTITTQPPQHFCHPPRTKRTIRVHINHPLSRSCGSRRRSALHELRLATPRRPKHLHHMPLKRTSPQHPVNLRYSERQQVCTGVRERPGHGGVGPQPRKDPGQLPRFIPGQNLSDSLWQRPRIPMR